MSCGLPGVGTRSSPPLLVFGAGVGTRSSPPLLVYNTSHQAPFIFSDADYMKRDERKEACNHTRKEVIVLAGPTNSYWILSLMP